MAPRKILGFNEGSLLRRTVLHVLAFVVGTLAFVGLVSFTLVTVTKSVLSAEAETEESAEGAAPATTGATAKATPRTSRAAKRKPTAATLPTAGEDADK